jgi:hypothetical protein
MKISVNDTEVFTLQQWEKDVIQNDIPSEQFDEDMKRRLEWVLKHKVEQCYARFEKEWVEKLRTAGVSSIPTDKATFVALVKARPDYQDRSTKDAAAKALLEAK